METASPTPQHSDPLSLPSADVCAAPSPRRSAAKGDWQAAARERMNAWNWGTRELAKATGLRAQTVRNILSGDNATARSLRKVENALALPLFTSVHIFAARRAVIEFYGCDPDALKLSDLDTLAKKYRRPAGLPARVRPRAALVAALENFAVRATSKA